MHASTPTDPATRPVTFLYSDADLVVVDKAPGDTVVPAAPAPPSACLQARVAAAIGQRVWAVHRLDRGTSGAVAFALGAEAHRSLSHAFEARVVHKTYRALVGGVPSPADGRITIALHEARKGKTRPARSGEPGAREAATGYRVETAWRHGDAAVALVEASPETGRHHQVRVHLRAIGHPILGDEVYGRSGPPWRSALPVPRLALHAATLDLPHPRGGRRVRVEAPLPEDLTALVRWLDAQWRREGSA